MAKKRIYHSSAALKNRLKEENKPITFVLGSAISRKTNGIGIADVNEITGIVKKIITDKGLYPDFKEFIAENDLTEEYKSLFEYISSLYGQVEVNEIIKSIVISNIDPHTGKHLIPQPVNDFTLAVSRNDYRVANIITTNFDTLLEESFKERGINTNSFSLVSDSHLSEGHNEELNIFHIHGSWEKNDSMHSHSQLDVKREKLEGSLHELFLNTSVVIMAYGGWEDSFTRTLSNIVNHPNADYKIAWCFYQSASNVIEDSFDQWFEKLSPAITHGRIQFFKGIDCTIFFDEDESQQQKKK